MRARLALIEDVTPRIKTFWFRPERPVRYTAGQFTELHLPHENADERGVRRWFTLSSSPSEELLGITTRFDSHLSSTFKQQLTTLKPGAEIHLADPMGDFVLPKDPSIPLVFVAGGLGITPVRSMIKWLHDNREYRTIRLIYTAPHANDLAFTSLFRDYNLEFSPFVTDQGAKRLTAEQLAHTAGDDSLIFISGPETMVETLHKELQALGVPASRLVGDYFPGYNNF